MRAVWNDHYLLYLSLTIIPQSHVDSTYVYVGTVERLHHRHTNPQSQYKDVPTSVRKSTFFAQTKPSHSLIVQVSTKGHLQMSKNLSNPLLITGTTHLHRSGWALSLTTIRTWEVNFKQAYRMCSSKVYLDSRLCFADSSASFTGGPGFSNQPSQPRSSPMEDTLFEINQTGLSPMWYDRHP